MLDRHPEVAIPTETHFLPALLRSMKREDALRVITSHPAWANMGLANETLLKAFEELSQFSAAGAVRIFFQLYAARFGKARWGDKTPAYRQWMSEIAQALPEAHFIHMIRDGRDVALSHRGLWFGPGDEIGAQATHWVAEIEAAREQARNLKHYREVKFEDLVRNPAEVLQELCRYLSLSFDDEMLSYHEGARKRLSEFVEPIVPHGTPTVELGRFIAIHDRTRSRPDITRAERWKTEMTAKEVRCYEEIAGPLLGALGYERTR